MTLEEEIKYKWNLTRELHHDAEYEDSPTRHKKIMARILNIHQDLVILRQRLSHANKNL